MLILKKHKYTNNDFSDKIYPTLELTLYHSPQATMMTISFNKNTFYFLGKVTTSLPILMTHCLSGDAREGATGLKPQKNLSLGPACLMALCSQRLTHHQ